LRDKPRVVEKEKKETKEIRTILTEFCVAINHPLSNTVDESRMMYVRVVIRKGINRVYNDLTVSKERFAEGLKTLKGQLKTVCNTDM